MRRGVIKTSTASGSIRIISGQWRGRKLPVLDAQGLRPTTDRTKETLFNWLMSDVRDSRCLDCFAGSGSLGLEALSRFAAHCTFIEQNKNTAQQLTANLTLLATTAEQAIVLHGSALDVALPDQQYDLVFIDPPFRQGLIAPMIERLTRGKKIANNALIYIESESDNTDYTVPDNWRCIKEKHTKQVCYRLFEAQ